MFNAWRIRAFLFLFEVHDRRHVIADDAHEPRTFEAPHKEVQCVQGTSKCFSRSRKIDSFALFYRTEKRSRLPRLAAPCPRSESWSGKSATYLQNRGRGTGSRSHRMFLEKLHKRLHGGHSLCGRATQRSKGNQSPQCFTLSSEALPLVESSEPPSSSVDQCDSGGLHCTTEPKLTYESSSGWWVIFPWRPGSGMTSLAHNVHEGIQVQGDRRCRLLRLMLWQWVFSFHLARTRPKGY